MALTAADVLIETIQDWGLGGRGRVRAERPALQAYS
jgi:hypothetical protein